MVDTRNDDHSGLTAGEHRLINDRDPKPLHFQFDAEQTGKFAWTYEERGPRDWKVKIDRI